MENQNNQLLLLRLLRIRSSCYQKNIGAQFTHLHIPLLCEEFFVMRHNIAHMGRQKAPKSELQSQFSMSKIIRIFLNFFP
jgi:hypothetical protein